MNIQARKLSLIEEFLKISDESIIEKLESIIRIERKKGQDRDLQPLSKDEFLGMIEQAKEDRKAGNVISHNDLKAKVKTWQ
jgi:hypothetical protein